MSESCQFVSSETCSRVEDVRQNGAGAVFPLADAAAREARDLVGRDEERLDGVAAVVGADQGVHLGQADDRLDPVRGRVVVSAEHGVLDARLGELALVVLVVQAEVEVVGGVQTMSPRKTCWSMPPPFSPVVRLWM